MAKKIEVYVDGEGDGPEFVPYKEGNSYFPCWEVQGITLKPKFAYWKAATVVIHEGKPERVYTHSEVDPLLYVAKEICRKLYHPTASVNALDAEALKTCLLSFGITLDPTEQE